MKRIILLCLLLSLQCDYFYYQNRSNPTWETFSRNSGGYFYLIKKKVGLRSLFVYLGTKKDAYYEIEQESNRILDHGFSILSTGISSEHPLKKSRTLTWDENSMAKMLTYTSRYPGYNLRLLVLFGNQLASVLKILAKPLIFQHVVILGCGDAYKNRRSITKTLRETTEKWKEKTVFHCHKSHHQQKWKSLYIQKKLKDHGLKLYKNDSQHSYFSFISPRRMQKINANHASLTLNDNFYNLLLSSTHTIPWVGANQIFHRCYYKKNQTLPFTHRLEASGMVSKPACPLFLRMTQKNQELWRARQSEKNYCSYYLMSKKNRIYCFYKNKVPPRLREVEEK